jgi:hypothetical protein
MTDAVDRYLAASRAQDMDALLTTLAAEAEVLSPISGRMVFRGRADLRTLLGAVYGSIRGLRWGEQIGGGSIRTVIGEGSVGPFPFGDAMVFELDSDGAIVRIRPHLRPWLGLSALAVALLPRLLPHPGVLIRALRAGSSRR